MTSDVDTGATSTRVTARFMDFPDTPGWPLDDPNVCRTLRAGSCEATSCDFLAAVDAGYLPDELADVVSLSAGTLTIRGARIDGGITVAPRVERGVFTYQASLDEAGWAPGARLSVSASGGTVVPFTTPELLTPSLLSLVGRCQFDDCGSLSDGGLELAWLGAAPSTRTGSVELTMSDGNPTDFTMTRVFCSVSAAASGVSVPAVLLSFLRGTAPIPVHVSNSVSATFDAGATTVEFSVSHIIARGSLARE